MKSRSTVFAISGLFVAVSSAHSLAQSLSATNQSPQACFEQRNEACLEAIYADLVSNPSDEKFEALYLHGNIKLENEDYEGAKDLFMMGSAFGGDKAVLTKALLGLYEQGKASFDPAECVTIGSESCLNSSIDGDDPVDSRNAQYLLGGLIHKEDPKRALSLFESAAEAGHRTAICEMQKLYATGAVGLEADYDKSVRYGLDCTFSPPFKRFDQKYFSKYEKKKDHRAFAHADDGFSIYAAGITSPELAASLAHLYCQKNKKRKPNASPCKVINVDGTFVETADLRKLPETANGIEDLIAISAQDSYVKKYLKESDPKVFVQSASGAWSWRSRGSSDNDLEKVQQDALAACGKQWQAKFGFACKVVNINGDWVTN